MKERKPKKWFSFFVFQLKPLSVNNAQMTNVRRRKINNLDFKKIPENLMTCPGVKNLPSTNKMTNQETALTQSDALQILRLKQTLKCFSSTEHLLFLFAHYFQSDT